MDKKKALVLFAMMLLVLALAACGNSKEEKVGEGTYTSVEKTQTEQYIGNDSAWCSALFEKPSTQYDNQLALVAAEMSEKAEDKTGEGIGKLFVDYGISIYGTYHYGGDGAFAIGHDTLSIGGADTTVLIIVARGTKTFKESIGDLLKGSPFNKTQDFLDQTVWNNVYDFEEQIWSGLNEYLQKYPELENVDRLKILVTGHSLGGAAASMVAARFTRFAAWGEWWSDAVDKEDIYAYTFGAIKVLSVEDNVSDGYENIHNIYNYYDSYGPNGNQKNTNASSLNAKFGHTEIFDFINCSESGTNVWDSCNNHIMQTYKNALRENDSGSHSISLSCGRQVNPQPETPILTEKPSESEKTPVVNDFAIEGTWKNVGTSTFGQAQAGGIVIFDGEHCNYYSPRDTYVFYYENGRWALSCVSYIFAETLNFQVDIIDEDLIDIYFGSDAVRLKRLSRDAEAIEEPVQTEFAIEGSWLSVGTDGFGQAQPGITVTFDGTHCNFYSPYDTYAFYQDGGQWRLDCTSFLFTETLIFDVEVIDENSINVYFGSICTELRRVN